MMKKCILALLLMCCSILTIHAQKVQLNEKNYIEINAASANLSSSAKLQINERLKAYDVYEFDMSELRMLIQKQSNQATLEFNFPGKKGIEVTIHENEMRSDNFRAVAMTDQGPVDVPRAACHTYKGYTQDGEDVRLSITSESIYGYIKLGKELLFLKSLSKFIPGANHDYVASYKLSDFNYPSNSICLDHGTSKKKVPQTEEKKKGNCYFAEFGLDADFQQFSSDGTVVATNTTTLAEMNVAEGFYFAEINLQFRIVFQNVWTTAADPYSATDPTADMPEIEIRTAWTTMAPLSGVVRDYVVMFSGRTFTLPGMPTNFVNGSVFGLSTMCATPTQSYAFISLLTGGPTTTTHELGHAIGGDHDDADNCDPGVGTIMCGVLGAGTFTLSDDNRENFQNHLDDNTCLNNSNLNTTFEAGLGSWTQSTTDDFNWSLTTGSTPTSQTGPTGAYQSNVYYYTEANGNTNSTAQLVSPTYAVCFSQKFFSFGYHMFGSDVGSLSVQITTDNGVTWDNVWGNAGNHGDVWLTAAIGLNPYVGETIQIRLTAVTGNGIRSDIALDDLAIGSNCLIKANPNLIEFPQSGGTQSFTVSGSSSWEAHTPGFGSWTSLSTFGNTVTVTADANPGPVPRMVPAYVSCGPSITTVTIVQAGDPIDFSPCGPGYANIPNNANFEGGYLSGWAQDTEDDMNWTVNTNGTPSLGTGPTSAASGEYYLYTEASGNTNKVANLISPCFNLAKVPSPTLTFSAHLFSITPIMMGRLNLQISKNGGYSWGTIWTRSGNQGTEWLNEEIDLTEHQNTPFQLRFNAITGSGYRSDIAIDAISITSGESCFDQYETNENFGDAHATTMGTSISFPNACLSPGDEDYFRLFYSSDAGFTNFYVRVRGNGLNTTGDYRLTVDITGNKVEIETHPENLSTTDTYIYLYGPEGGYPLAQDNNSGVGLFSKITKTLPGLLGQSSQFRIVPDFDLSNFPNPFSQITTFEFHLNESSKVSLSIKDINGKLLAMPINDVDYTRGNHQLEFDANVLPAGVYTYTLKTKDGLESKQMVVVR